MQLPASMIEAEKKIHQLVTEGKLDEARAFGLDAIRNATLTPLERAQVTEELKAKVKADLDELSK